MIFPAILTTTDFYQATSRRSCPLPSLYNWTSEVTTSDTYTCSRLIYPYRRLTAICICRCIYSASFSALRVVPLRLPPLSIVVSMQCTVVATYTTPVVCHAIYHLVSVPVIPLEMLSTDTITSRAFHSCPASLLIGVYFPASVEWICS